jgi:hypothetical protein
MATTQAPRASEALLVADSFGDLPGEWQAVMLKAETDPAEPASAVSDAKYRLQHCSTGR